MVHMQMSAENVSDLFRSYFRHPKILEIRPIFHMIAQFMRPLPVVAATGIYQNVGIARANEKAVEGNHQAARRRIKQSRFEPAPMMVDPLRR